MPSIDGLSQRATMEEGLWREIDVESASDFELLGPSKLVIDLRALRDRHYNKLDMEDFSKYQKEYSNCRWNDLEGEMKENMEDIPSNSPCGRILRMIEESFQRRFSGREIKEETINPTVQLLLEYARVAQVSTNPSREDLPTVRGNIFVKDLEKEISPTSDNQGSVNEDVSAFQLLLRMCGMGRLAARQKFNEQKHKSITSEEFNRHFKAVMREAARRHQMSESSKSMLSGNSPLSSITMSAENGSPTINQHPKGDYGSSIDRIDPWISLRTIQRMSDDSVMKSYY